VRGANGAEMMAARRAHAYPQVVLTAGDLVDTEVLAAPPGISAADALRLARRRRVRVLACGATTHVLVDDLARADGLGLGDLAARRGGASAADRAPAHGRSWRCDGDSPRGRRR